MRVLAGPLRRHGSGEFIRVSELPAICGHSDEVGVAEPAYGTRAIHFPTSPQVAAGKAQKNGRPAGVCALALQRGEDLLDRIHDVLRAE